ncbi:hypothetical protein [Micromonospora sp. NPDC050495]|uniref:hypothetical protein n=1 Tax=Micromonospora sp. NPDC050495 TaxID=3154936 RepID=UPI00340A7261
MPEEFVVEQRRDELDLRDDRHFYLIKFEPGHSSALIRGIPDPSENMDLDEEGDETPDDEHPGPVLDVFFAGVSRVCCWKDFPGAHLRQSSEAERAEIERRIGALRSSERVFLLEADSMESYVIAMRVYWGEFDIDPQASSPLVSEDRNYRRICRPLTGAVLFAD